MKVPQYEIIIPHVNVPAVEPLAVNCLRSIAQYSADYCVVWVQNGGLIPDAIKDALDSMSSDVIDLPTNMGFVKAVNIGLKHVVAPYIVIMNNDTEAAPDWLTKLRAPLQWPIVMSGPRTTTQESWQGVWKGREGTIILPRSAMLAFFCTMFDYRVFNEVGYLDEDFGVGFGDDDNFCQRVQKKDLKLALVQDLVIPHYHRSTFRSLYSTQQIKQMQDSAMELYRRKL